MTDRNDKPISVGQRAVIVGNWDKKWIGRIGEIRGTDERSRCHRNAPAVRIADGPVDEPHWSAWVKAADVVVIG